ncbi:MAG TPA: hypothetical protein PK400_01795 [Phycisphaerales bacterium]|nr:hypothetical protein [Phycisphaerales bacterium]HRQ74362.1 hypothetical protein [Phycisphaerales bacterium]
MSETWDQLGLPEMSNVMLSDEVIEQLFRDLAQCAVVSHITVRASPRQHTPQDGISLEQARTMLLSGDVQGVQLRYQFQGEAYCDTLMRAAGGVRLVRMKQAYGAE